MKPSETLMNAAERIHDGKSYFACYAISTVYSYSNNNGALDYFELLKPMTGQDSLTIGWFGTTNIPSNQEFRVFALLLASAIAASEGR